MTSTEDRSMISTLGSLTATTLRSANLKLILDAAVADIAETLKLDGVKIFTYEGMTRQFNLKTSFDRNPRRTPPPESLKTCEAIVARVGETGQPLIFEDALKDARYEQLNGPEVSRKNQSRFFAAFPIKNQSTTVGALLCTSLPPRKLDSNEIDFLEAITGNIALALEHTELRDLLGKKDLELQLSAAELTRKSAAQSQTLSFVSREIRTYLNVVIGSVELLQHLEIETDEGNADRKDTLKIIAAESWQLLEKLGALLQAAERNTP